MHYFASEQTRNSLGYNNSVVFRGFVRDIELFIDNKQTITNCEKDRKTQVYFVIFLISMIKLRFVTVSSILL